MSDDGKVISYIEVDHIPAIEEIRYDRKIKSNFRLTIVSNKNEPIDGIKKVIAESEQPFSYRLSRNGNEIIWMK